MTTTTPLRIALLALSIGCGPSDPALDASTDTGGEDAGADILGAEGCVDASDCDDGRACNGRESCNVGFCVAGVPIDCDDGIACTQDICDEESLECRHLAQDIDGDGHGEALCRGEDGLPLGDDCDDTDPERYPGGIEVCDALAHDEDCDPTTLGDTDLDEDGFVSSMCCNVQAGARVCGGDCSDGTRDINPGASETCNGVDDDCDGLIDDVVDGVVVCSSGLERLCTTSCGALGTQSCREDCLGYGPCVAPEVCNGCDDDLDGVSDEEFECAAGTSAACPTSCGSDGIHVCTSLCEYTPCVRSEVCNYCDDDGDGDFLDDAPLARDVSNTHHDACVPESLDGSAQCLPPIPVGNPMYPGQLHYVELTPGLSGDEAGAYWIPLPRLGFGVVRVRARIEARIVAGGSGTPNGGWSLMLVRSGTGVGSPENYGAPDDRVGLSVEWRWGADGDDTDEVRHLALAPERTPRGSGDGSGHDAFTRPFHSLDALSGGWIAQEVELEYRPDDLGTTNNEEYIASVLGPAPATSSFFAPGAFANGPDGDYEVGAPMFLGITTGHYLDGGAGHAIQVRVILNVYDYITPSDLSYVYSTEAETEGHCRGI
ncbi:MAG: putative metal-binding motif-containing protein [Polyangiales bacterium]